VRIASDRPADLRQLRRVYPAACRAEAGRGAGVAITVDAAAGRPAADRVAAPPTFRAEVATLPEALGHLEGRVDTLAVAGCGRVLLIHADVVAGVGRGVFLSGPSAAGKSTLVAALALSGFACLSDELAAVEGAPAAAPHYPKAIGLKEGGWRAGGALRPAGPADPGHAAGRRRPSLPRRAGAPSRRTRAHPACHYPPPGVACPAELSPVDRGCALAELARHSPDLPRLGPPGLVLLARLVEGAGRFALAYADLPGAVAALTALTGPAWAWGGPTRPAGAASGE
jgi:hypothetical protein